MCLAYYKSMANLIDGCGINHWSGIPTCTTFEGGNVFGDSRKQSTKCQRLRVIIIYELSMVSAELFGALEYVVRKVIRSKYTYKLRTDGSTRPFGGVNVLMFTNWWHPPPFAGTSLRDDPSKVSAGLAQDAIRMLRDQGRNCVRRTWS